MPDPLAEPVKRLVGTELHAVTFVWDYIQLSFNGPTLSLFTPLTISTEGVTANSGDDQFCNRLCGLIGKQVAEVRVQADEALHLVFVGGSSLLLSLKAEGYTHPEAGVLHGAEGETVIF